MKNFSIAHMLETPLEGATSHLPYRACLLPLKDDNTQYNDGNDEDYHQYGTHKHSCKQKVYFWAVLDIISDHDVIDDMSETSLMTPCHILPDSIQDNVINDKSHHNVTDDVTSGVTDYVTDDVMVLLLLISHWQCYCWYVINNVKNSITKDVNDSVTDTVSDCVTDWQNYWSYFR